MFSASMVVSTSFAPHHIKTQLQKAMNQVFKPYENPVQNFAACLLLRQSFQRLAKLESIHIERFATCQRAFEGNSSPTSL